jgi:hypothetical protein
VSPFARVVVLGNAGEFTYIALVPQAIVAVCRDKYRRERQDEQICKCTPPHPRSPRVWPFERITLNVI